MQRGVDYIEKHLDQKIELRAVSKAAGMSHAHFQRTFRALTGDTLSTYVRMRRMAKALDLLLSTDRRVLDIAVGAGFESQEAFARAFKRTFGITPTAYRQLGQRHRFLKKVRFDEDYLLHVSTSVTLTPELTERPQMQLVGLLTSFFGRESEKNNLGEVLPRLWDDYMPRAAEIPNAIPEVYYGVIDQDRNDPERLVYTACREVHDEPRIPPGMIATVTPRALHAVFEHRGPAKNIDQTVNYIYGSWLVMSNYRHTSGPDLEIYDARWHATLPSSVMRYAIPVTPA